MPRARNITSGWIFRNSIIVSRKAGQTSLFIHMSRQIVSILP